MVVVVGFEIDFDCDVCYVYSYYLELLWMLFWFCGYGGFLCLNGFGFIFVVYVMGGNVGVGKNFEFFVVEVLIILIEGFIMLVGKVNL